MRRLVHFSCGAASAVAAKLTLAKHSDVAIVRAWIKEEHPDNDRFSADVERWLGAPIVVLRDERDGASARTTWLRRRYMVSGRFGIASCADALKRDQLKAFSLPNDIHVLGFTSEEAARLERFEDFSKMQAEAPLIEAGLTKADCLAMIARAGIELPMMYRLGFNNNNCIGCPKGGEGYWNRIRTHFPVDFVAVSQIQEAIGPGSYFFRNRKTNERFGLKDLKPEAGRHTEPEISCSFYCQAAEDEIASEAPNA